MFDRRQALRSLEQSGQGRRFHEIHPGCRLAVVEVGCGFDAVAAVAGVDLVAVEAQNLLLGVLALDLHGQHRLLNLAPDRLVRFEEQVAGKLLGHRAGALGHATLPQVVPQRAHDPLEVDPGMFVEVGVLGGDQRVQEALGDLTEADQGSPFLGEIGHEGAVVRQDARHLRRAIVLERAHVGEIEAQEVAQTSTRDRRQDDKHPQHDVGQSATHEGPLHALPPFSGS